MSRLTGLRAALSGLRHRRASAPPTADELTAAQPATAARLIAAVDILVQDVAAWADPR